MSKFVIYIVILIQSLCFLGVEETKSIEKSSIPECFVLSSSDDAGSKKHSIN